MAVSGSNVPSARKRNCPGVESSNVSTTGRLPAGTILSFPITISRRLTGYSLPPVSASVAANWSGVRAPGFSPQQCRGRRSPGLCPPGSRDRPVGPKPALPRVLDGRVPQEPSTAAALPRCVHLLADFAGCIGAIVESIVLEVLEPGADFDLGVDGNGACKRALGALVDDVVRKGDGLLVLRSFTGQARVERGRIHHRRQYIQVLLQSFDGLSVDQNSGTQAA